MCSLILASAWSPSRRAIDRATRPCARSTPVIHAARPQGVDPDQDGGLVAELLNGTGQPLVAGADRDHVVKLLVKPYVRVDVARLDSRLMLLERLLEFGHR